MLENFVAHQFQEKINPPRKSFRVSDSAKSGISCISEDSAIEDFSVHEDLCEKLEVVSLEIEPEELAEEILEEHEDSASLLKRSIRRNSYHNPLTNAEIVIDESKTLFRNTFNNRSPPRSIFLTEKIGVC